MYKETRNKKREESETDGDVQRDKEQTKKGGDRDTG